MKCKFRCFLLFSRACLVAAFNFSILVFIQKLVYNQVLIFLSPKNIGSFDVDGISFILRARKSMGINQTAQIVLTKPNRKKAKPN